jgi:hypothetical protein
MSTRLNALLLALSVLSAIGLVRAEGAPAVAPAKEMARLEFYEGSWECKGKVPESPLGPARMSSTKVSFQKDLDGMWYLGRIEEAASTENPRAYRGTAHMSWDGSSRNYLMIWVDNLGGYATQTSPGWEGDKMVWLGDGAMNGQKLTARDTFTKEGAEMRHFGELEIDGAWIIVQDEVCRRPATHK